MSKMRSLKPLFLISIGAVAATTEFESQCNSPTSPSSVSTIYITVSASPITETLYTVSQANSAFESAAASSSLVTESITISVTSTETISVVQATPLTGAGVYSFTVDNDTTSWMGVLTPPATGSYITSTSFITLQPVETPVSMISPGASGNSTSYLTLLSTIVTAEPSPLILELASAQTTTCLAPVTTMSIDVTVTETLAPSAHRPSASTGLYSGLARNGWNATMAPLPRPKEASVKPLLYQEGSTEEATSLHGTSYPKETYTETLGRLLKARNGRSRLLKARQVGVVVSATIDDSVVSWTNSFVGQILSISEAKATLAPIVATPPAPSTLDAIQPPVSVAVTAPAIASSSATRPISITPEVTHTFIPVTATAPAFGPFLTITPVSEAGETSLPVTSTATAPAASSSLSSSVQTTLSAPAVPTTTISAYPWDLSSASSVSETGISEFEALSVTPSLSSTSLSIISTSLSTAASTAASACDGAVVSPRFVVNFDDLPIFSTGSDVNDTDIPPIFNPYRKLYWEEHFGYVPPPTDPFPPHSPPQLAIYQEAGLNITSSPDAGLQLVGEVGAGPRASDSAYWIDAHSAWLGCANIGPGDCYIEVRGYAHGYNESIISQSFTQPPCPGLKNCSLALVEFADGFNGLSGLQIIATVADVPVTWYMDDLSLGWSNNTCAAQLERSSSE